MQNWSFAIGTYSVLNHTWFPKSNSLKEIGNVAFLVSREKAHDEMGLTCLLEAGELGIMPEKTLIAEELLRAGDVYYLYNMGLRTLDPSNLILLYSKEPTKYLAQSRPMNYHGRRVLNVNCDWKIISEEAFARLQAIRRR